MTRPANFELERRPSITLRIVNSILNRLGYRVVSFSDDKERDISLWANGWNDCADAFNRYGKLIYITEEKKFLQEYFKNA